MLNSRAAIEVSVEFPTAFDPMAVPKYRPLCAAAAPKVPAAAFAHGAATNAPASSAAPAGTATATTRRRRRRGVTAPRRALTGSDISSPYDQESDRSMVLMTGQTMSNYDMQV